MAASVKEAIQTQFAALVVPELQKCTGRVEVLEKTQERLVTGFTEHDGRIQRLEEGLAQVRSSVSGASSGGGGSSGDGSGGSGEWKPKWVEIKNFCDFDSRTTEGLTYDEASELVGRLKAALPQQLQSKLGDMHTRGTRTVSVRVDVMGGAASDVQAMWRDVIKQESIQVRNREPWVTLQRRPEEQSRMAALGRGLDGLKKYVLAHKHGSVEVIRPDWVSFTVSLSPLDAAGGRPQGSAQVLHVPPNGALVWDEGALETIVGARSPAVMALARRR